jgi:hypothetical protein
MLVFISNIKALRAVCALLIKNWHELRYFRWSRLMGMTPAAIARNRRMQNTTTLRSEDLAVDANLTQHANQRMIERNLSSRAVQAAFAYGRVVHTRGATIYAIGRKEVESAKNHGVDLSRIEGVQVVCSADGTILTVYRNRDFRGLRPTRQHRPSSGRGKRSWAR